MPPEPPAWKQPHEFMRGMRRVERRDGRVELGTARDVAKSPVRARGRTAGSRGRRAPTRARTPPARFGPGPRTA